MTRRVLLVSWCSFADGEATAGDALAVDTVRRWRGEAGDAAIDRLVRRHRYVPVPFDTRLATDDWRVPSAPEQVAALVRRCDLVVTSRMHGLVLALRAGVPVLAVDPIAGGAKVSAQARAWSWPAVACPAELDRRALAGCPDPALLSIDVAEVIRTCAEHLDAAPRAATTARPPGPRSDPITVSRSCRRCRRRAGRARQRSPRPARPWQSSVRARARPSGNGPAPARC